MAPREGNNVGKKDNYSCKTAPFICQGRKQFVTVEDSPQTLRRRACQAVRRRTYHSKAIGEETLCPITSSGCAIEEIAVSPSGLWLVTERCSGQGEWGYDVFRACPLSREAGTPEEYGYMLGMPKFTADETRLVGGFGPQWLGGWWAHTEDDFENPARGGLISFGLLFVHHLPSHRVERHELRMDLPKGWLPDDLEAPLWYGARDIEPSADGIRLTLPGGIAIKIESPLPRAILLPTPHPSGGRLLAGTAVGVKRL